MEDILKFTLTLLSLFLAFWVAKGIGKARTFRSLANRRGRDVTLDGLRGYLALSVFFHHMAVTWTWKTTGVWASSSDVYFLNFGKVGVFIFFMITGYLFVGKILYVGYGNVNWYRLFESRVFRIFPLYLAALLIISLIVAGATGFQMNVGSPELLKEYVKWFVFHGSTINGFDETKRIIAEVDWTLKYEWLFYVSLPLAAIGLKFRFGGVLMLLLCMGLFVFPVQVKQFNTAYFILFAIGGLVAWARRYYKLPEGLATSPLATAITLVSITAALFYPATMSVFHILLITVFFTTVVMGNDLMGILSNQASIVLGEISYSIYLLHGIVLYFLFTVNSPVDITQYTLVQFLFLTPVLTALIVAISAVTFNWVEKPGMELGRKYHLSRFLNTLMGIGKVANNTIGRKRPAALDGNIVSHKRQA